MRLGRIDLNGEPSHLIRIPLLYECCQLCRCGLFQFFQIEAAGHGPKTHCLIHVLGAVWQVPLQKIVKLLTIAAVEGLKPGRSLMTSESIGKLRMGEANCREEDYDSDT